VSEKTSCHIKSIAGDAWKYLNKLRDLYDTHFELEFIQLQLSLFNFELKDGDSMALALEIKDIKYDLDASYVKFDITLTTYIKALYFTYCNYLE